jgi:hypothetical protein
MGESGMAMSGVQQRYVSDDAVLLVLSEEGTEMTPALELAKECGILFISEPDGVERFYHRAQTQVLREAAEKFIGFENMGVKFPKWLRRMADELESKT